MTRTFQPELGRVSVNPVAMTDEVAVFVQQDSHGHRSVWCMRKVNASWVPLVSNEYPELWLAMLEELALRMDDAGLSIYDKQPSLVLGERLMLTTERWEIHEEENTRGWMNLFGLQHELEANPRVITVITNDLPAFHIIPSNLVSSDPYSD